jgi:hypothetical protein
MDQGQHNTCQHIEMCHLKKNMDYTILAALS